MSDREKQIEALAKILIRKGMKRNEALSEAAKIIDYQRGPKAA